MVFNFFREKVGVISLFPTAAKEKMQNLPSYQFIDVREIDEMKDGAAQGSVNMPKSSFYVSELPQDKNIPLFFICRSGGRSSVAAEMARSAGHTQVFNVDGGTLGWQSMGLPMK